ncbi:anaphase-promoting complex subunit 2 isoform X1 [Herrania umbratica]|uniref:Anaphase-promoting complex subunit 2 n=1 Tax=Herrania umbratica TaxID=108875 RepID=A0A6J1BJR5_9ROSI|nr:anaphase-promoting complex subunit 2 isoform X1 [Herrania umbratica]
MEPLTSCPDINLGILMSLDDDTVQEILQSYDGFCAAAKSLLNGSIGHDFVSHVHTLCKHGLHSLARDYFLRSLEEAFEKNGASRFWRHFEDYSKIEEDLEKIDEDEIQRLLCKALKEICLEKENQEKCLLMFVHALQSYMENLSDGKHNFDAEKVYLFSKYQLIVSSILMASLPRHFPEVLHWYFKGRLEELSTIMDGELNEENDCRDRDEMDLDEKSKHRSGEMDIDECYHQDKFPENNKLVRSIGKVVRDLRNLGFTSMTEDAYATAIFLLLKAKVHNLAGDDYRSSVLDSIKEWIQAVPLQFLNALLAYLGDSISFDQHSSGLKSPLASQPSSCCPGTNTPSEGLIRWKLRLEYFAYETLQDLRIAKLFEIIVDYPESSPAIEDLKQCLEYTGQHSKLVESFISALRYRLLTAGASTNDILHQYVSTIKALRTIDPAGVFLEAVGEPIRDYLKGRKDTIKCIVTMLTDGSSGNPNGSGNSGDSLLEELNRDEDNQENVGVDDDFNTDDKQAWIDVQRWEPDPVEADPSKGSRNRRKVDILGMVVGIIGSKDQLVNEYRIMLAEKLLNKSDYDIDSEIRTLELLKIHFGESSMQKCEIMLNDLIDSKRTNTNIKATINKQSQIGADAESAETGISLDNLDATIISSNFWPPIQEEALIIPYPVDQLLSEYARRFHEIKTPRKLLWKKNLGTVKLELQFEDKAMQFTVAPVHAAIIMQFQDQMSWTSKNLAAATGIPVDVLYRRISFWISKGVLTESLGTDPSNHVFTLVDGMVDTSKSGGNSGNCEELLAGDEEPERSVASIEDQLRKEMTVYEKFIMGMLTNFGSMALDRIHNTLKMFCVADPPYDKSLQQLQSFLSGLVSEEKLELRDGMYFLKK